MEELKARGFLDCVLVNSVPSSLVYSASHPSCPMCTPKVAIKLRTLSSPSALQAAYKEVEIHQRLSHPNIIRFCECLQYPEGSGRFGLVTEWGEKHLLQDMTDRVKNQFPWKEEELRCVGYDLIHAFAYAQRLGILQHAVKLDNIVYSPITKIAKLRNFSSAECLYDSLASASTGENVSACLNGALREQQKRTVHEMAKPDVYALGVTLLALINLDIHLVNAGVEVQAAVLRRLRGNQTYSDMMKGLVWEMMNVERSGLTFVEIEERYCPLACNVPAVLSLEPDPSVVTTVNTSEAIIYGQAPAPHQYQQIPQAEMPQYQQIPQAEMPQYQQIPQAEMSQYQQIPQAEMSQYQQIPQAEMSQYQQIPQAEMSQYQQIPQSYFAQSQPSPQPPALHPAPLAPVDAHHTFNCCEGKQGFSGSEYLQCPSGRVLYFCSMDCYARNMEKATRNYTIMQINCPICGGTIREGAIKDAFRGQMDQYRSESLLKCAICEDRKATFTIDCGHLHCDTCLESNTVASEQQHPNYFCTKCGKLSTKKSHNFKKKFKHRRNLGDSNS